MSQTKIIMGNYYLLEEENGKLLYGKCIECDVSKSPSVTLENINGKFKAKASELKPVKGTRFPGQCRPVQHAPNNIYNSEKETHINELDLEKEKLINDLGYTISNWTPMQIWEFLTRDYGLTHFQDDILKLYRPHELREFISKAPAFEDEKGIYY